MIEFNTYRGNPGAPTIFVNKVGGIYCLDTDLVKCTFALEAPCAGGTLECVETVSLLWPSAAWHESHDVLRWAIDEIRRGTFAPADGPLRLRRN